ncbi:hypothetical protein [Pontibacter chinhatensis]|uniref:Uncharacterized protein n=1 Tax=Pontibacter chinhatensis TaxID=1436961 RepID=A0A1I2TXR9_9BACT|nr:hypothetical protein [Pontibacter chinhatensis]SFG69688.1 hypothetical protein SAMN05421739_103320 [Pontibacter chinhatensis]
MPVAKYKPLFLIGLLLALASCERPSPPAAIEAGKATFNLTSYLQGQRQKLEADKPMVLKSVATQGREPEVVETMDVDWEDELAVFEEADLSRPSMQEYYTRQEQQLEDGSVAVAYTKREDAEPQVHFLRLVLGPDGKLRQLNASLQDQNIIFFSRRTIELHADPQTGDLSGYSVLGVQKMIFGDSLRYEVKANL